MIHVFIVNPIVCEPGYAMKLRKQLEEFPDLHYYVFSTRRPGHETDLVEVLCRFFDNEELRFYCCGGSGTMRNMLRGFKDITRAEVAMIPYGTCDFLKAFTDDLTHFRDVSAMINGEVVYVDYIKSNLGIALNCVTFGADTDSLKKGDEVKALGLGRRRLPGLVTRLHAAFLANPKFFDVTTDSLKFTNEKVTLMYFGNGSYIGGKYRMGINENVDDGLASYTFVPGRGHFARLNAIKAATGGNLGQLKKVTESGLSKFIKARRTNGMSFNLELDGELCQAYELRAEIVRQGLRFVLPKRGER
jgi:diacylglycerol kinase family enzyme